MNKTVEAIILCGGEGKRMGESGIGKQKCLLPVEEVPVLSHIFAALLQAFGSVDLKLAVSHEAQQVIDFVERNNPSKKMSVTYVHDKSPGIYSAYYGMREHIHDTFIGTSGDVIVTPGTYTEAYEAAIHRNNVLNFSLTQNHTVVDTHPLVKVNDTVVTEIIFPVTGVTVTPEHFRDMNVYSANTGFFELLERFPSKTGDVLDSYIRALSSGIQMGGIISQDPWFHMGYKEDLEKEWLHE